MCMDAGNFYFNTPLAIFEYMKFPIWMIPDEIITAYNLHDIISNGYIYVELRKAVYGLKQAGKLANDLLKKRLASNSYRPTTYTPGLWKHDTKPLAFTLVVDNFGVKYVNQDDAKHLEACLAKHYPMKSDWTEGRYVGIYLNWDYKNGTVKLTMPDYAKNTLHQFQHKTPKQKVHSPSKYTAPQYGVKIQLTNAIDKSPSLTPDQTILLQQVTGNKLYYAMLQALNDLATQTATGNQTTAATMEHFLNYCATNPNAELLYRSSDVILVNDSDAAYLVAPEAKSRAGGHTYFVNRLDNPTQIINGAIYAIAKVIKNVMSSAAEAEVAGLFMNAKELLPMRTTLDELGHPQPATPMQTDNSTACGITNKTVKQRRSKAIVVGWMNGRWFLSRREGQRCLCHGGFLAGRAVLGFSDFAFFEVLYSIDMLRVRRCCLDECHSDSVNTNIVVFSRFLFVDVRI
jgi:hypothetical protein